MSNQQRNDDLLVARYNHRTKVRGTNDAEYQIYLACADNGEGMDICTGCTQPLKTYEQWLNS